MPASSGDDELLSILLVNLRNAAATFGEGTPPYESIRTTVEEHLQAMKAKGNPTNLTSVRHPLQQQPPAESVGRKAPMSQQQALSFRSLAYRPKPGS